MQTLTIQYPDGSCVQSGFFEVLSEYWLIAESVEDYDVELAKRIRAVEDDAVGWMTARTAAAWERFREEEPELAEAHSLQLAGSRIQVGEAIMALSRYQVAAALDAVGAPRAADMVRAGDSDVLEPALIRCVTRLRVALVRAMHGDNPAADFPLKFLDARFVVEKLLGRFTIANLIETHDKSRADNLRNGESDTLDWLEEIHQRAGEQIAREDADRIRSMLTRYSNQSVQPEDGRVAVRYTLAKLAEYYELEDPFGDAWWETWQQAASRSHEQLFDRLASAA